MSPGSPAASDQLHRCSEATTYFIFYIIDYHGCSVFYILHDNMLSSLPLQRRTGLSLLMLQKIEGVTLLLGLTYTDHAGVYMFIFTNYICDLSYGLTK